MGVANGQYGDENTFNNAFMARNTDTDTVGKVQLLNTDTESGAGITNIQGFTNELADTDGVAGFQDPDRKNYTSNEYIADGDNRKVAIQKLDAALKALSDATDADIEYILNGLTAFTSDKTWGGGNHSGMNDLQITGAFNAPTANATTFGATDGTMYERFNLSIDDHVQNGSDVQLTPITTPIRRLIDPALVSIATIDSPDARLIMLVNKLTTPITIRHLTGSPSNQQIDTGTGADVDLSAGAMFWFFYDILGGVWHLAGGSGGGASAPSVYNFTSLANNSQITTPSNVFQQIVYVSGAAGPIDLNILPFGSTAYLDGVEITLIGTHDDNTVTVVSNDAANGVIKYGVTLGRGDSVTLVRSTSLNRFIIK